jgi:carbon monoxide dehydrogenase subunit G
MQFQHSIAISAPPQVVWDFLWDVEQLAHCIPGCIEANVVEPHRHYTAIVADRVGPIKLKMPLDLVVKSAEDLQRLHVECNGKDSALGSSVKVDIVAVLTADEPGTVLALDVNADVRGKIAGLGFGLFKRKFDDIMTQFGRQVKVAIEESHPAVEQG